MDEKKAEITTPIRKKKAPLVKRKWFKRTITLIVLLAIATAAVSIWQRNRASQTNAEEEYSTAIVTRGDIEVIISGSGTVSPIEQYSIVPTVNGKIESAPYEEGQEVQEGAVLYKFESDKADTAIDQAKNTVSKRLISLNQIKENIANLTVKATASGRISDLDLHVGDTLNGKVCTITDSSKIYIKVPFNAAQTAAISVGDSATVSIEKYMTTLEGEVVSKSTAASAGSGGVVSYDVEILIANPGNIGIPEGVVATAAVHTATGDVESGGTGSTYYPTPVTVNAEQSGEISVIYAKNGDWIEAGQTIVTLTNDTLMDNYTNAELEYNDSLSSLSDAYTSAEDYTLTSPISGTILVKNYKAGDTVYGTNSTELMVVADTSKMVFTINVDELDIAKIQLGQTVDVTADALEGTTLYGTITKLTALGTTSNGVTTYPIEVTIDNPGELRPGMNVNAEILVQQSFDTIVVPVGAVSYYDGKYYVTVVGEMESNMPEGSTPSERTMPSETAMPEGEAPSEGQMPEGAMSSSAATGGRGNRGSASTPTINTYAQQQRVEVETGISNDDYTEILSGLEVGQIVIDSGTSTDDSSSTMMMMGGMGG
ncbi:MAG: efflux RND transporter periplasmic adaptor subunit, partial [Clostridia bacterium]|nr:efflux RND transporter periplasmic adaptor subunit [Clostridia bacterium]